MRFLPYLSSPDRFYTLLEILQRMMLRARSRREKGPLKNFGAESIPSRNDNDGWMGIVGTPRSCNLASQTGGGTLVNYSSPWLSVSCIYESQRELTWFLIKYSCCHSLECSSPHESLRRYNRDELLRCISHSNWFRCGTARVPLLMMLRSSQHVQD